MAARKRKIVLRGTSDLLMHKMNDDQLRGTKVVSGQADRSREWVHSLYHDGGNIHFPASWFEAAIIKAASNFQIRGKGKKTYKDLIMSAVYCSDSKLKLKQKTSVDDFEKAHSTGATVNGCSIDEQSAKNPATRGRMLVRRPKFDKGWEVEFQTDILDEQISDEVMKQVIEHAGQRCGFGTYRPRYGRFELASYEAV